MKILILNNDYSEFIISLYQQYPGLERRSYDEQVRVREESCFGDGGFYSNNLQKLGHEAWDVYLYNQFMQRTWANEHGVKVTPDWHWKLRLRRKVFPWVARVRNGRWLYEILAAQLKMFKPDVVLNHGDGVSTVFLKEMKPYVHLLVRQIAAPISREENFGVYDLILSSLPNFVEYFRKLGVCSELIPLAFEPAVLTRVKRLKPRIAISFVGSFSSAHQSRIDLLEFLCSKLAIHVWGPGLDYLPKSSAIRSRHMGTAWGIEMYNILYNSKITLNYHIGIAESYANNMRLFEATGVGAFVVTDWKQNLHELFEPGKEVVAYRTREECLELIEYYLNHDVEREGIARAGQRRALRDHTYYIRMRELLDVVARYLR